MGEAAGRTAYLDALRGLAAGAAAGPVVVTEGRRVGYAELWEAAAALSAWLRREGLAPGDVVGITIRDEYRNLVATLAAMHAGLAQVTLPTHEPEAQRADVAARTGVVAVLGDDEAYALPGLSFVLPDFSFRGDALQAVAQPGDGTCLLLVSSGTTGQAKLIPVSQQQLLAQAGTYQWPRRRNVFFRPASIEFNNSKRHRLYAVAMGDVNVLGSQNVAETVQANSVDWLVLSAAQAQAFVRRPAALPATSVRIDGSPVQAGLRRAVISKVTPNLYVTYGASEIGSIATAGPSDHDGDENVVGYVHPGVSVEIVDDEDRLLPPGVGGRVRIRSAGMATRYHGDPEATARAFRDGWFYPGDVARFDAVGRLVFEGRADDMMNLASINVFPAEIERAVEGLPGVVEAAAFAMRSAEFGDVPMLAVVGDGDLRPEAILAHAKAALGLRAPRKVFVVDGLPRNAAGKVLREELARRLLVRKTLEPAA